jgi:hypothetical protein
MRMGSILQRIHDSGRKTKPLLFFWVLVCLGLSPILLPRTAQAQFFDEELYGQLLDEFTRSTRTLAGTVVNYKELKKDPRWLTLLQNLQATSPSTLKTEPEKMAYWLNAYNVLAINTVLENYPIKSIRDAGSLFNPVWEHEGIEIEGRALSLGFIEHEILRPMGDPRVHAGIVCASSSCPSLLRTPWNASTLEPQLNNAMRTWLSDHRKGLRVDLDTEDVWVSRVFKWFSDDFAGEEGIQLMLIQFAPEQESAWLRKNRNQYSLNYFPYDWDLNE